MGLFYREGVPVLVSSPRGTVLVRVEPETCLWQAAMLVRMAGAGALVKIGEALGESWLYGVEGGEA